MGDLQAAVSTPPSPGLNWSECDSIRNACGVCENHQSLGSDVYCLQHSARVSLVAVQSLHFLHAQATPGSLPVAVVLKRDAGQQR